MGNPTNNATNWVKQFVQRNKRQLICISIFIVLVSLSPFTEAIFTWQFPKNFLINLFDRKPKHFEAPLLSTPITHEAKSFCGRYSRPKALIEIFINQKKTSKYRFRSDQEGYFNQAITNPYTLKPGDQVWVRQTFNNEQSSFSPVYKVIDSTLITWYIDNEKTRTSSLEKTIDILLSWSVLILGGFVFITIKESKKLSLLYLLIPIFFLFILSIYYGISCKTAITTAIGTGISVSADPMIDLYWWKQIQIFEQAIFLSGIFFIWNLGSSKLEEEEKKSL